MSDNEFVLLSVQNMQVLDIGNNKPITYSMIFTSRDIVASILKLPSVSLQLYCNDISMISNWT